MKITAAHAQDAITLIGRSLIALLFIVAGFDKIMNFSDATAYLTSQGLAYPSVIAFLAIIFELGGGLMVLLGWKTRFAAFMLFVFTVPVILIFHSFWSVQPALLSTQSHPLLKHLGMMGATLYLLSFGAGNFSFDGKKSKYDAV